MTYICSIIAVVLTAVALNPVAMASHLRPGFRASFRLPVARVSTGTGLLQEALEYRKPKILKESKQGQPFLDGDFLRDSSNPLDVYEDMNITTPPPDYPIPITPANKKLAPGPAPAGKGDGNSTGNSTGKGAGKGKGK